MSVHAKHTVIYTFDAITNLFGKTVVEKDKELGKLITELKLEETHIQTAKFYAGFVIKKPSSNPFFK